MSTPMAVILGCAVATFAIKAAGPVALGGRDLPILAQRALALLAPALLSALVAVSIFAHDEEWGVGADTAGVAAGGLLYWRTQSVVGCAVAAAAVTALLRAVS
jgi:branched-subunit amino acid transport protein